MKLISHFEIKGFRSIRDAHVRDLGHFTALAGLNNSGKSNLLRALNAFLRGETDPGTLLDFESDYFRPDRGTHKPKRIRLGATFHLPAEFRWPKALAGSQQLLGGGEFKLAKEWRPRQPLPFYYLNDDGKPMDPDDRQKADLFLELLNFRYIQNRAVPSEVVRAEHRALRDVLVRRLSKRVKGQRELFAAIQETSDDLVRALADRFRDACPDAGDVRLATPKSWHDLAFTFGYRLSHGGVELEDVVQGAGIQSLLMFETLLLIDRDFFQQFGWRQAALWAVEEPESSLHSSLEARVAAFLATAANEAANRLQVVTTTHSDMVLQYADRVFLANLTDARSSFEPQKDARRAIEVVARAGVSRWVHPLLFHPLEPLVLVEGKIDYEFFCEAFRLAKLPRAIEVSFLEHLTGGSGSGGAEALAVYLKANVAALRARQLGAPVVVIFDWDAAGRKQKLEKTLAGIAACTVLCWPEPEANPALDEAFKGVERYFSDRMIREAIKLGAPIATLPKGRRTVPPDRYGEVKDALRKVVSKGLTPADLKWAEPFLRRVLAAAGVPA